MQYGYSVPRGASSDQEQYATSLDFSANKKQRAIRRFVKSAALPFGIAFSYFLINYYWDMMNRFGGILDIDEAGYASIAVNFARQLAEGGPHRWFRAFAVPNIQAPLSYASASILMFVLGLSNDSVLITNAIFGSLTILLIFLLTRRLSTTATAMVAIIIVVSNPYFTSYTRNFEFAAASACCLAAFAYFFELSDVFARVIPSALAGASVGFLLLSRTVNISFIPPIVITSLCFVGFASRGKDSSRITNIIISIFAAVIVAGPWYYINLSPILNYLFSFGYGSQAAEHSITGGDRLLRIIVHAEALIERMYIPHIVMISAALIIYCSALILRYRFALQDRSTIFSIYLVAMSILSFAALLSSDNLGSGFDVPLAPIFVAGLSVGISRLVGAQLKVVLAGCALVVSVATFAPQVDDRLCRALKTRFDGLWPSAATAPFDCGGTILSYLQQGGGFEKVGSLSSHGHGVDREAEKQWVELNEQIAAKIEELNPSRRTVVFAHRHIVTNINTVNLWYIQHEGRLIPATQINVSDIPDAIEGYEHWLSSSPNRDACLFIANTGSDGQFRPVPTYEYLRAAFQQAGMVKAAELPLPDGRQEMVFWKRSDPACQ